MLAIAFVFSMVSQLRRGRTQGTECLSSSVSDLWLRTTPGHREPVGRNHTVQATTVRHLNVPPRPLVLEVIYPAIISSDRLDIVGARSSRLSYWYVHSCGPCHIEA